MSRLDEQHNHVMAFGVGCFHFGVRIREARTILATEYVDDLKRCLESLDTISDIDIEYTPIGDETESYELESQPDSMCDGTCIPHWTFFKYSFSIYLPLRLQAELLETDEDLVDTESEHFKVSTKYTYHGPVTYIECQEVSERCSPSTAVVAIRKYLQRQLDNEDLPLRFESIGPSPFHVDFHLNQSQSSDNRGGLFESETVHKPGYDLVTFTSRAAGESPNSDHLKIQLFDLLDDELGLFYELMRERSAQIDAWYEIQNDLYQIIDTSRPTNIFSRVWGPIQRRKSLQTLFRDLLSFRANAVMVESSRNERFRSLYDSGKFSVFLKQYLDDEIEDAINYPTDDILRMLEFEESRLTKTFEWAAILLAAILGGVVGAMFTQLAN